MGEFVRPTKYQLYHFRRTYVVQSRPTCLFGLVLYILMLLNLLLQMGSHLKSEHMKRSIP